MNRFEGPGAREARIRYLDGDFQVVAPGAFVRCAVTGESIPLDELRYWSTNAGDWIQEAAEFDVWIGGDSTATLHAAFEVVI